MKTATIIGAGFSGLTYGMFLQKAGWKVTVLEKDSLLGGGVRTFFHGGHPFTYGPRHFLTPYKKAYDFMQAMVPMRDIKKINYSYNEKDRTYYTYPPHMEDIPRMPEHEQIARELEMRAPEGAENKNFEEFWINRIGPTLYTKFIKYYNKKAWIISSNTVNDCGFQLTVKNYPLESGDRYEFKNWYNCYPLAHDGYNRYFDMAAEGCTVRLNTRITGIDPETRTVHIGDEKITSDILISTLSLDVLMNFQYGPLAYVGRDFFKIVLPVEEVFPKDVYFLYYPNENEEQTRIVEYKKFTQHKSPDTLIVMEVPSMSNKLYATMIQSEVDKANKYLGALPSGVFSVGRMGRYRYVDMDDILMECFELMDQLKA